MSAIKNLIQNHKFIYVSVSLKDNKSKNISGLIPNWHLKTLDNEYIEINKIRENDNLYNQIYIRLQREYIIIDTDTETSYNKLVDYLNKNNLYLETAITKSFKGINNNFNRHFWFMPDEPEDFNDLPEGQIKFNGGEIFYGNNCIIGEYKTSKLDRLPFINRNEYNDILSVLNNKKNNDNSPNKKNNTNNNIANSDKNLLVDKILSGLNKKRYDEYLYWFSIYCVCVNENIDLEIFNKFSSKSKKYNKQNNDKLLNNIIPKKGYTIATLYYYLKEDDNNLFIELSKTRKDFWDMSIDNHTLATLYFNITDNNYIYNYNLGWYEYNNNNVLISRGKNTPLSLITSISEKLKEYAIEQQKLLNMNDENYLIKMKKYVKFYEKVGNGNFKDNIINYLANYYLDDDLDKKINNINYIAFNNKLYDYNINKFRNINKNDYITITTEYDLNIDTIDDKYKKQIKNIIHSIFENKEIEKFWFYTTALSLFGNDKERFYIHSGSGGGNGKGLTQRMLSNSLGKYYKQVSNNFLMGSLKKGQADPELASCVGVRYLGVSEPDDTENKKFNITNLKTYSGNDELSTRNLYGSSFIFKPQFTMNISCNEIPKMTDIDGGIKRRIIIIDYPFEFRDKEKIINPNIQKPINYELKKTIINDNKFIQSFILLLIKYAHKYKNIEFKTPEKILKHSEDYCNENNEINDWFNENYIITNDIKDKIKAVDLLLSYNNSNHCIKKLRPVDFSKLMDKLKINKISINNAKYYTNIKNVIIDENDDL